MNTNDYYHSSRYNAANIPTDNYSILLNEYECIKGKISRSIAWNRLTRIELDNHRISLFLIWMELYEIDALRCHSELALSSSILYWFI